MSACLIWGSLFWKTNTKFPREVIEKFMVAVAVNLSDLQEILRLVKLNEHTISDAYQRTSPTLRTRGVCRILCVYASKIGPPSSTNLDNYLHRTNGIVPNMIYVRKHSKCIMSVMHSHIRESICTHAFLTHVD